MKQPQTILFVGGGSLGHVLPSLAVAEALHSIDPALHCHFLCADRSSETSVLNAGHFSYSVLRAPKFPRALSFQAMLFPFVFLAALRRSYRIMRTVRPSVVFTKGGYISIPPCLVAWCLRIPLVAHTSDAVPNLSDRILGRLAKTVCTGFPISLLPSALTSHAKQTGNPIRSFLRSGSRERGLSLTGFSGDRPIVLMMGGSQGALRINQAVDRHREELTATADIVHLTGEGKGMSHSCPGYVAWPSVGPELADLYCIADVVVTRAGAGAISELATLRKATILLPLQGVAHDHQVSNAEFLAQHNAAEVMMDDAYDTLPERLAALLGHEHRLEELRTNIGSIFPPNAAETVAHIVLDVMQ